jgi:hypothetical protein
MTRYISLSSKVLASAFRKGTHLWYHLSFRTIE